MIRQIKRPLLAALMILQAAVAFARPPTDATEAVTVSSSAALKQLKSKAMASASSPVAGQVSALTLERNIKRYSLDPKAITASRVVAVRGDAAVVVTAENLADQINAGAVFVDRSLPEARVAEPPASLVSGPASAQNVFRLGYRITASKAGTRRPVQLDAWARDGTGLLLDGARSGFRGTFQVAVTSTSDQLDDSTLETPVPIAIQAIGASEIAPQPLEISRLARWHDVEITVSRVEGPEYFISVSASPQAGPEGDKIPLQIVAPTVSFRPRDQVIPGWGIGQTTIDVYVSGMRAPEGLVVPLRNDAGRLSDSGIKLDADGKGSVGLRSSRASGTTVGIDSPFVSADPIQIRFETPWLFFVLALAGGLVGALLQGRGRERWPVALAIGAGAAVVMTLAWAVGIDWVSDLPYGERLASSGEAVVFVLGVLGALVGVKMLLPKGTPS